jgi:cytochrome c6
VTKHIAGLFCLVLFPGVALAGDPFSGSNIYSEYCVSCHGGDGRGDVAGVPSFRGGSMMMRSESELIDAIKAGKNLMPAFNGILEEYQIDDVVSYIRTFN